jgi:hypothetical protein
MTTMKHVISILVLGLVGGSLLQSSESLADTITWHVQNNHSDRVLLEFYSQNRKYAWPSNGKAYALYDRRIYRISLDCYPGEHICYGAWVRGDTKKYWGVGPKNRYRCNDCCYFCDGSVVPLRLLE